MPRLKRQWTPLAATLMFLGQGDAMVHKHLTFNPPFMEYDHFGKRSVSSDWDVGGETKIMKNFVRLTPDQQSKTGSLWSVDEIGQDVFTSVLEFRISGKGDRFFGDGLAFWVVTPEHRQSIHDPLDNYYYGGDDWGGAWDLKVLRADLPSGDFHGFVETFKGVGVIVDTYRNEEFYNSHKDVTVVVNTGNMTKTEILHASAGCNAQVRYYEKRDDFDPSAQSSRLKVEVSGRTLTVQIDAKNSDNWVDCTKIQIPEEMDDKWASGGHVGITASTGELSDNHDVVRLATYVNSDAAERGEEARGKRQQMEVKPNLPFLERMTVLETELNSLLNTVNNADHEQEHILNRVQVNVEQLMEKTEAIEKRLTESLELLDSRLQDMEEKMNRQLQLSLNQGVETALTVARGWRAPFAVLVVGLLVAGGSAYRGYVKLRKSHLL